MKIKVWRRRIWKNHIIYLDRRSLDRNLDTVDPFYNGLRRENKRGRSDVYWEGYWIPILPKGRKLIVDEKLLSEKLKEVLNKWGMRE